MKHYRKGLTGILLAAMLLPQFAGTTAVSAEQPGREVDIVFTHDTHSHVDSFETVYEGEIKELGGFARIKTIVDEKKAENPDTLVVDAGDFSMGTLVQTIYEEQAVELRMLGAIGCEVTTLGNHEFDYRSKGLSNMLNSAKESGDVLPEVVICNVDWEAMEQAGLGEGQQLIADSFANYDIKDYVVLEKGDVRMAVIGVFGNDALACAPTCELLFQDPVEAVKETVAEIKANEDVDFMLCVSHSGTWEDESKSEDEILAKNVPELDLIISGHTHSELAEPIVHGNTAIVSCGEYTKRVGTVHMRQREDGRWDITQYDLVPTYASLEQDAQTQAKVDAFKEMVDSQFLVDFGYTSEQVLAKNEIAFSSLQDLELVHTEHNLGDIISDSYVYAVEHADDYNGVPVAAAVVPSGTIRDTYLPGDITVDDVFTSFSLGIGADGVPGYPLIEVYLTGEELRTAAEIDASVSDYMKTARLYCSRLNMSYNPHRMILNKVTDLYLTDVNGERVEIEDDKLYRVVADLYSGQMLSAVTDMSYGILSIVPKYADGTPIEDFEDVILTENGKELKAWDAIARYMASFPDTDGDGTPDVPASYGELHGRKAVEDSRNIIHLLKNPNKYAVMIIVAVVVVILLIVLIVLLAVKLVKRIRRKGR